MYEYKDQTVGSRVSINSKTHGGLLAFPKTNKRIVGLLCPKVYIAKGDTFPREPKKINAIRKTRCFEFASNMLSSHIML